MCLRNAEVCKSLGENEKSRVWSLLSQLVDMRLNENRSSFDGWGGFGGAAFGMSMVKNLLRYYESLGDVQMLSTIVCVLRDSRRQSDKPGLKLIPSGQDEKYDMYMHRYSDLLYGWGLLTIRAELLKNLVRPYLSTELTQRIPGAPEGEHFDVSGIGLLFSCPRCGGDTEPGTNCCRSCQDYAFRCALCDNAKGMLEGRCVLKIHCHVNWTYRCILIFAAVATEGTCIISKSGFTRVANPVDFYVLPDAVASVRL